MVVFGDSWVDGTVEEGQERRGRSWPEVLCETVSISLLSFLFSPFLSIILRIVILSSED